VEEWRADYVQRRAEHDSMGSVCVTENPGGPFMIIMMIM
jgi:hypothetical protein